MLNDLTKSTEVELNEQAMNLLFRLPTDPLALQSLSSELNFIEKTNFETEYILIAIQSHLNNEDEEVKRMNVENFISSGNSTKIFNMMIKINKLPNPTKD